MRDVHPREHMAQSLLEGANANHPAITTAVRERPGA